MAFIRTIPPSEAQGAVREMYEQAARRFGYVPNWARAFSLRPGVRDGWAALLTSIQSNLPARTYELATLAAAGITTFGAAHELPRVDTSLICACGRPGAPKLLLRFSPRKCAC